MEWLFDDASIDWAELSELYRMAPLGNKEAKHLQTVFSNSRYKCFVRAEGRLVGAGRALADGGDCSYFGFRRMRTAMAIFADQEAAERGGLIE